MKEKQEQIKKMLDGLETPARHQNQLCVLTILALAGISKDVSWEQASNNWMRVHDIIQYIKEHYDVPYAENTRETIRKQAIHAFREAAFIEDNGKATNSPHTMYRITEEVLGIIRKLGTKTWAKRCALFKDKHKTLKEQYADKRKQRALPFSVNGQELQFSPGKHNELQKNILEQFIPQFAPDAKCLYVGDSADRALVFEQDTLSRLGVNLGDKGVGIHGTLPDIILYSENKDWLYLIEAVTSVGPISPERLQNFKALTVDVASGIIYITAFPDKATYRKFIEQIAWDTEVWLANEPGHMLHLNGDRFMGPR